ALAAVPDRASRRTLRSLRHCVVKILQAAHYLVLSHRTLLVDDESAQERFLLGIPVDDVLVRESSSEGDSQSPSGFNQPSQFTRLPEGQQLPLTEYRDLGRDLFDVAQLRRAEEDGLPELPQLDEQRA